MAKTIDALLREVGMERFFLYVHDFGSAVAYVLAIKYPERVLGLIIQNGNAHEEGLGELQSSFFGLGLPQNGCEVRIVDVGPLEPGNIHSAALRSLKSAMGRGRSFTVRSSSTSEPS